MNTAHLRNLINQLQFQQDQELIEKSIFFCNKIFWNFKDLPNIGNLNYALGIQFACESLKRKFSVAAFYSLAGSNKRVYDAQLIEVRKKLNIYPKIDLRAVAIRFGCEIVIDKVLDLIDQYKTELTKSNLSIKDDYFSHPSISVACFIICCEINKIKVDQSWLQGISLMNLKELKNLIKNIKTLMGDDINEYKLSNISDSYKLRRTTKQDTNEDQQSNHNESIANSTVNRTLVSTPNKLTVQANENTTNGYYTNITLPPAPKSPLHPVLVSSLKRKKRKSMVDNPNYLETEDFKSYLSWKMKTIKKLKFNSILNHP